jgi:pyruvate/2-oxoglutarate/acetoin dehydrogenase E1 component
MEQNLRTTIRNITKKHLKKFNSLIFGQNLTGVGWVDNTLPELYEKDGVIELPMADVADGGIVTGAALMNKRPFYIIRYQGYNWFNCIFIINYACKSKSIWKRPCPMFIRGISLEGSIGPVSGSSHVSIFYKMPGIKIYSPMTSNEYKKVYKKFIKDNDVYYISEHRKSYSFSKNLENYLPKNPDIILMPISVTRFEVNDVINFFKGNKYKARIGIIHLMELKPFKLKREHINYIKSSKHGIIITDNDYSDGLPGILAKKINERVSKKIYILGLKDKTAGHHSKVDNLPPSSKEIINFIIKTIKK